MPSLVVLDGFTLNPGDNPWTELAELGKLTVYDRTPREEIALRANDADVVLTNKTPLDAATLATLPRLRGIAVLATGYNVVDVAAARARGVVVCNVPAYSTKSVAQHTLALLLELANGVGLHDRLVHAGEWSRSPDFSFWRKSTLELDGLLLGLVGYGAIGREVAPLARALGMRVRASESAAPARAEAIERCPLDELFRTSDVVSLHCPLTPETERLVRRERLVTMKPSALLINTGRGGLIDEPDLAAALNEGVIAGAALDVLSSEPPSPDNPLLSAKNCVITPHIAWTSLAARQRLMSITVENVRALLAGRPINVVQPG